MRLVPIKPKKTGETYKEALERHLNELPEEQKNVVPTMLFVCSLSELGTIYQVMAGGNVFEIAGALDLFKYLLLDKSLEEL